MSETPLLQSPLHERHVALGAKFAEFGGWTMPVDYPAGTVAEHTAVRSSVGIFDVSHLGKALVTGPGAAGYVNATLSNDLGRIQHGKAQYTLCCDDETGGIVDDMIAYYQDDEHVLLVPNAANSAEVIRRLREHAPDGVEILDHHTEYAVLAVLAPGPTRCSPPWGCRWATTTCRSSRPSGTTPAWSSVEAATPASAATS